MKEITIKQDFGYVRVRKDERKFNTDAQIHAFMDFQGYRESDICNKAERKGHRFPNCLHVTFRYVHYSEDTASNKPFYRVCFVFDE